MLEFLGVAVNGGGSVGGSSSSSLSNLKNGGLKGNSSNHNHQNGNTFSVHRPNGTTNKKSSSTTNLLPSSSSSSATASATTISTQSQPTNYLGFNGHHSLTSETNQQRLLPFKKNLLARECQPLLNGKLNSTIKSKTSLNGGYHNDTLGNKIKSQQNGIGSINTNTNSNMNGVNYPDHHHSHHSGRSLNDNFNNYNHYLNLTNNPNGNLFAFRNVSSATAFKNHSAFTQPSSSSSRFHYNTTTSTITTTHNNHNQSQSSSDLNKTLTTAKPKVFKFFKEKAKADQQQQNLNSTITSESSSTTTTNSARKSKTKNSSNSKTKTSKSKTTKANRKSVSTKNCPLVKGSIGDLPNLINSDGGGYLISGNNSAFSPSSLSNVDKLSAGENGVYDNVNDDETFAIQKSRTIHYAEYLIENFALQVFDNEHDLMVSFFSFVAN